jgi:hypothetical protein
VYAFVIDGERLRPLWTLPLQQVVYRQLMYLVVIQSVFTALAGVHLRWHRMERYGSLRVPTDPATAGSPSRRPESSRVPHAALSAERAPAVRGQLES